MDKTQQKQTKQLKHLIIGAIGIVYGDIGTSPLYTVKECFSNTGFPLTEASVLGILSLILWSITLIVSIKYVFFILQADNNGEGGILALTALVLKRRFDKYYRTVLIFGIVGAALFYGDAVLTPAISVLSAVEGISIYSTAFSPYVIPLTVVILLGLFLIQSHGTANLGKFFGPAMIIWFFVIAILGLIQIIHNPIVLKAINPWYGINFLTTHGLVGVGSLGAVVLAITGAEALYADMGHFGRISIQRAWFYLVFPSLALNYMGQAALILTNNEAIQNPFYFLVPTVWVFPLMILSTIATIIASQAVISGLFSISWQAIQLGYLPRMQVIHTSGEHIGQVYVPMVNKIIMVLTIGLVLVFKSSNNLASAYGFAVTGIMVITTILTTIIALRAWEWSVFKTTSLFGVFLLVDLLFCAVNSTKIVEGGWMPLLIAVAAFYIMTTWIKGRNILADNIIHAGKTIRGFKKLLSDIHPLRIPGVAVYMNSTPENIPNSFSINYRHNKVMHEKVIFLSVITRNEPRVKKAEKIKIIELGFNVYEVIYSIGFKEVPNITQIFERCDENGLCLDLCETSFFMSRGIPVSTIHPRMSLWRAKLFIFLAKNAMHATEYYKIPYARVIELGVRIKI
ncbi:potassium transporter Kup [Candidatus Paracaedibacter symbiosus]|uniref:potassium transporter Kup n=1 Tax=Candidatus Paracaedibacter symbiosus TaxID=244582 RepID=UPI0005099111|nr:potassium transporter Kup [Candidatus Paracaedibacter symbiosus]